jgi:hypothetical protein
MIVPGIATMVAHKSCDKRLGNSVSLKPSTNQSGKVDGVLRRHSQCPGGVFQTSPPCPMPFEFRISSEIYGIIEIPPD